MIKKNFDIAFVGMSHLGLSSAIAAAKYFDNILCVDENENKIDQIKKFKLDYGEPDLKKNLNHHLKRLHLPRILQI